MKFLKKSKKDNNEKCPHNLEYGICELCPILGGWNPPIKEYIEDIKKSISPKLIKLLEQFKSDISSIHQGVAPEWKSFFATAKKLESEWEDLVVEHGECAQFSSEVMDTGGLDSVEWIYKDSVFLNGVIDLIEVDNHFACWLLLGDHTKLMTSEYVAKIFKVINGLEDDDFCDECYYGNWWDSPITYLAFHINADSTTLSEVYKHYNENLQVLCALAANKNTPKNILSKLSQIDEFAEFREDNLCPFFEVDNPKSINIAYCAKKTLELISN
jgi:hypothetical protein